MNQKNSPDFKMSLSWHQSGFNEIFAIRMIQLTTMKLFNYCGINQVRIFLEFD